MENIQLIQVSPTELADLINEGLRVQLEDCFKQVSKPIEGKEFLTRKETAYYFAISLVCLHDWANKKILKPYKMGNRTYFKRSELEETLLSSNSVS